jgi:Ni,Fe-hydrogenase I cytochrome b subunit
MCVKNAKAAQKYFFFENKKLNFFLLNRVAWVSYVTSVGMQMLCVFVGCLLYAKYSQCDPLRANIISRPDQVKNEFRN